MNKYGAIKTEIDGLKFDSRAEANRWRDLLMFEKAGLITNLRRQIRYILIPKQIAPNGEKIRECAYVCDFEYRDAKTGDLIVEDVKGAATESWRIKRKMMLMVHGIWVKEVRA